MGVVLILAGLRFITKNNPYPGYWALLPTVGAACLIAAGPHAWFNRVVLSNRIMVWIGLISYPLYLWHWPLLSFAQIIEGRLASPNMRIAAVFIAVIAAWFTYEFVEKPMRAILKLPVKYLIIAMALVGISGFLAFAFDGLPTRHNIKILGNQINDLKEPIDTRRSDGSCKKFLNLNLPEEITCLTKTSNPELLIIGDSHALALNSAVQRNEVKVNSLLIGLNGCIPLSGYSIATYKKINPNCDFLATRISGIPKEITSKKILIVTRGSYYFMPADYGIHKITQGSNYAISIEATAENKESQLDRFKNGYSNLIKSLDDTNTEIIFL